MFAFTDNKETTQHKQKKNYFYVISLSCVSFYFILSFSVFNFVWKLIGKFRWKLIEKIDGDGEKIVNQWILDRIKETEKCKVYWVFRKSENSKIVEIWSRKIGWKFSKKSSGNCSENPGFRQEKSDQKQRKKPVENPGFHPRTKKLRNFLEFWKLNSTENFLFFWICAHNLPPFSIYFSTLVFWVCWWVGKFSGGFGDCAVWIMLFLFWIGAFWGSWLFWGRSGLFDEKFWWKNRDREVQKS